MAKKDKNEETHPLIPKPIVTDIPKWEFRHFGKNNHKVSKSKVGTKKK